MAQRIQENRKGHLQENGSRYSSTPRYFKETPAKLTKLRDGQEQKNKKGNIWEKTENIKTIMMLQILKQEKVKGVDYNGNQISPNGSKNKTKNYATPI